MVGGKAASLARLVAAGIPVPDFFVVTSAAFEHHLAVNSLIWPASDDPEIDRAARRPDRHRADAGGRARFAG